MSWLPRLQVRADDSSICIGILVSGLCCLTFSVPLTSVPDDFQTLLLSLYPSSNPLSMMLASSPIRCFISQFHELFCISHGSP